MFFILALRCFFRILFGKPLPVEVLHLLPEPLEPRALPAPVAPDRGPVEPPAPAPTAKVAPVPAAIPDAKVAEEGALHLLGLLQREGRLVDFLQERLEDYTDSQIGAAVRDIHRGLRGALDTYLPVEPVMPGRENDSVNVDPGF